MRIILVVPIDVLAAFATKSASDADLYLSVGCAVRDCLRRGLSLPFIAQSAETTIEECLLAFKYAESSNALKFQALVEEWPWSRITTALAAVESGRSSSQTNPFQYETQTL